LYFNQQSVKKICWLGYRKTSSLSNARLEKFPMVTSEGLSITHSYSWKRWPSYTKIIRGTSRSSSRSSSENSRNSL